MDKLPPLGEPIPSLEMSAPYDFPDPPGTPVKVIWLRHSRGKARHSRRTIRVNAPGSLHA